MILLSVLAVVVAILGCASAGAPPGGPERKDPPQIISISPDSAATGVNLREVEFKFDEVVSDRPSGASATNLDQLFLVSPMDGAPNVGWHRSRITVRPRKGYRANTAYRVTMLPGLADLRGNIRKEGASVLFSTGATFPPFTIIGRVFDWPAGRPANGAFVQAISKADTTLIYVAASDSLGQFDVGPLAAGTYLVRGLIDANSNRAVDRNERWDTTTVVVSGTSPATELDAIERDSVPPVFDNVGVDDSLHLRVTFDKPILPGTQLTPSMLAIKGSDSIAVPISGLDFAVAFDRARLARDSIHRADSLKADSAARRLIARPAPPPVAAVPGAARPAPPPPRPRAPAPERAIIITLGTPLKVNSTYRISATGFRESSRSFARYHANVHRAQACSQAAARHHRATYSAGLDASAAAATDPPESQQPMTTDARRALPSVTALLESDAVQSLLAHTPRAVVVDAIRRTLDEVRAQPDGAPASQEDLTRAITANVARITQPSLRRVVNATGVVLHTNLGRAPLARAAIDAIARVAGGFSNLEYDIENGSRGSRYVHCAGLLRELTGAEDALVVNNCAAALVLALDTLAHGRDAIVSRGELIEIGGSFRIPEIMAKSGARLVEVGTTNRTHLDDYRRALSAETGVIVKVHRSNFELTGYVADASAAELAALADERGLPLLHDLGSGLLMSLVQFGLTGEPTASDALRAGAAIVTMSGDKLLGGPQAGLILGRRALLERIRKNPLTRAYRVDKLTLAALEATLALYRDPPTAVREIPVLAQLSVSVNGLRARGESMVKGLDNACVSLVDSESSVGGGAFPTAKIPSVAIAISGKVDDIEATLRTGTPAIVGRVADGRVLLDLRTIFPDEDTIVMSALQRILK